MNFHAPKITSFYDRPLKPDTRTMRIQDLQHHWEKFLTTIPPSQLPNGKWVRDKSHQSMRLFVVKDLISGTNFLRLKIILNEENNEVCQEKHVEDVVFIFLLP